MLYPLIRPALFRLDAERAHRFAIAGLKLRGGAASGASGGPLASTVAGIAFPNPLGMAAGFDKDGEVPDALLGLGFGFVEVGSITPLPQPGNPKPRLFRLTEDHAVINRMGFNNGGAEAAAARLAERAGRRGVVAINLGANKESADRIRARCLPRRAPAPRAGRTTRTTARRRIRLTTRPVRLVSSPDAAFLSRAACSLARGPP